MKRILSRTLMMALTVSMTLFLTVMPAAKAEAQSSHAEKLRKTKEAGFIAYSDRMNWDDAKAYCQKQGGRLPLIDAIHGMAGILLSGTFS